MRTHRYLLMIGLMIIVTIISAMPAWPATGRIAIIVNPALRPNITSSLNQYVADLQFEGYTTVIYDSPTMAADLRSLLQAKYQEPESLVGCVVIGEAPLAYWMSASEAFYSNDLYFTDLDGTWIDGDGDLKYENGEHSNGAGDRGPEIWLGRIPSSYSWDLMGYYSEADCVRNYFLKDHHYRTGQLAPRFLDNPPYGALCYGDEGSDDAYFSGVCSGAPLYSWFGYSPEYMVTECDTTTPEDYLFRLTQGYEHIALHVHGLQERHGFFDDNEVLEGYVFSSDILNTNVRTLFFTLYSCETGQFYYPGNIGTAYILSRGPDPNDVSRGLTCIAATHDSAGEMWNRGWLWGPFRVGNSWGESLKQYWASAGSSPWSIYWKYYFITLLGDPTLRRSDYMTFSQVPEWIQTYNSSGTNHDWARALVVSPDKNSFIVGDSGAPGASDILTQKRDTNGSLLWERVYDSGNPDYAKAVGLLSTGGIGVVGATQGSSNGLNWRIVRYGGAGDFKWTKIYNGPANKDDRAEDVAIDAADNLFVAGWSTNQDNSIDLVLQKYNKSNSTPLWTQRLTGFPASLPASATKPVHVGLDAAGNAYVAGTVRNGLGNTDLIVAKYSTDGVLQGQPATFDAFGGIGIDELADLRVDPAGNCYAAGCSTSGSATNAYTVKLRADLSQAWVRELIGYKACNVALDPSGNVFVSADSTDMYQPAILVKYDANGNQLWSRTHGEGLVQGPTPLCMSVDNSGAVIVAGQEPHSGYDFFTRRYSSDGILQWSAIYGAANSFSDKATAVGVDIDNNVYVFGYSDMPQTGCDWALLKYQP